MDEKDEPKSTIVCREICNGKTMSPYDARGVYKTQSEVDRAVRNGTFDISKTMYVDRNNRIFFLAYEKNELEKTKQKQISMQKMQFPNSQQMELDQTQKLDQLLRKQNDVSRH